MSQRHISALPLAGLEAAWARGLLSSDELLGCLLRHLVQQEQSGKNGEPDGEAGGWRLEARERQHAKLNTPTGEQLKTQNATLRTQLLALNGLLRQVGDTLDGLTGEQLDLWRAGGLWYWHWEDTGELSPRGLRSSGEALVDAVERRAGLVPGDGPRGEESRVCRVASVVASPRTRDPSTRRASWYPKVFFWCVSG